MNVKPQRVGWTLTAKVARFMTRNAFPIVLGLALATCPFGSRAATVILKGDAEPVRGYFVSENAQGILLRVPDADGELRERLIPRESIEVFLRAVDDDRLASLRPDQPRAYRDYAEELAEKRVDPEARETSLRLYLIAAHLAPEELGKSALLGMTPLARNPAEARRIRALAFLLDPKQDRNLLKTDAMSSREFSEPGSAESPQVNLLLRALEFLRRGRYVEANRLIRRPGLADLLDEHREVLSSEEFLELCMDRTAKGSEPPVPLVARIIKVQLRLLDGGAATALPPGDHEMSDGSWGELQSEEYREVISELSLETLTEFDPRENLFRDRRWVRAD